MWRGSAAGRGRGVQGSEGLDDRLRLYAVVLGTSLVVVLLLSFRSSAGWHSRVVVLRSDPKANGRREYRRPSFASSRPA